MLYASSHLPSGWCGQPPAVVAAPPSDYHTFRRRAIPAAARWRGVFSFVLWFAAAGAGRFARRGKTPLPASPRPGASAAAEKEGSPSPIPRKAGKSHETVQLWGENGKKYPVSQQTQRVFSGKRRKSPGRPARRFLFALCLIGSAFALNTPHPRSPGRRRGRRRGR